MLPSNNSNPFADPPKARPAAAAPPFPPPTPSSPYAPLPYQVIHLGEVSPEKIQAILEQVSRAWGKDVAQLIDKPTTFKEQMKSDFTNAAYRVGSTQLINTTKNFLVQLARKSLSEESKVRAISELLDTEIGTAFMAMFIGLSVSQIPQLANNPKMQRILKEFRVSGMATVGNSAVEALMIGMLPVVVSALKGIEKAEPLPAVETITSSLEEELFVASTEPAPLLRQS